MELREELKYKSLKNAVTLKELHYIAKVNALSRNKSAKAAALDLKVAPRTMATFVSDNNINKTELSLMREHYKEKYEK